jgi:ATP synthase protein I
MTRTRIPTSHTPAPGRRQTLAQEVGASAKRKLKARKHQAHGVWFGLGMMGLIGWSVVVPTLLGALRLASGWTRTSRGSIRGRWPCWWRGLVLGCLNAWHWVTKEDRAIRQEQEDDGD